MAITVRSIIEESCARANLIQRKRAVPADIFTAAYNLFLGILSDYSNRNFITAYRDSVDFTPNFDTVLVGEGPDAEVSAPKIQKPVSAMYKIGDDYNDLNFISFDQFFTTKATDIVSWQPVGANLWKLYFKPYFMSSGRNIKLVYNKEMRFEDNDEISLPNQYIELLTRALAYQLSISYPRADATKTAQLQTEMEKLEKFIMGDNSSNRIMTRDLYGQSLLGGFLGGTFLPR